MFVLSPATLFKCKKLNKSKFFMTIQNDQMHYILIPYVNGLGAKIEGTKREVRRVLEM